MINVHVTHNEDDKQFEAEVAGGTALITYSRDGGAITFLHTEVPREATGQGVAQVLVRTALQYARDENLQVIPECGYVAAFVRKHRDYDDILHPDYVDQR